MATKKQRRRREKLQRHEYEYVIENEEGEEVVVESPRTPSEKATSARNPAKVYDRRGRELAPPSWRRVFKRAAIFGPIIALIVFLTGGQLSTQGKILNVIILLAIFLPFSYLVDMLIYRTVLRRQRKSAGS